MATKSHMPAIFLEYPVFTVVALDEDGKILVGGGGGSSKTGVPNSMELYQIEMIDGSLSYAPLARYNFGKNEVIQASLNPNQPHEVVLSAENSSIIAKICKQGKSLQRTTRVEEIGAQCVGEEKDETRGSDLKDTTLRSGHIDDGSDDGKRSSEEVRNDQEETKDESINHDEDRDESIKDGDKDISDEDEDINDGDEVMKVEDEDNEDGDGDFNDGGTNREGIDVDDETMKAEGDGGERLSTGSNVGGTSSLMSDPQTIKDTTQQPTDAPNLRRRKNEGTAKSEATETTRTSGVSKDPEYSLTVGQENRTDFAEKESLQKVARFSCDGRFVITGGVDGCMRVWEYPSFDKVHELKGHSKEICDLDVHPDKLVAVSVSRDAEGIVWDVDEGEKVNSFTCQSKKDVSYWTRACRFSPGVDTEDAVLHTIAVPVKWNKSRTTSSYLVRRETTSWNVTKTRAIPKEMLSAMCVSCDGRLVAIGTAGGDVHVYNYNYELLTKAVDVHNFSVTDLTFSLLPMCTTSRPEIDHTIERKMAVVSVSIDRTCCVTMVTKKRPTWTGTTVCFLSIVIVLVAAIWCLLFL